MRGFAYLSPRPAVWLLARKGTLIWIGIRCSFALAGLLIGGVLGASPFAVTPLVSSGLVLLTSFLSLLDRLRRGDVIFLENIGISRAVIAGFSALPALAGEVVLFWLRFLWT